MTKDVLVNVTGAHITEEGGGPDEISVITAGTYYFKNGRHYLIYDEVVEEGGATVRNTIKVGNGSVDIIKSGAVRNHMVFEEGKNHIGCYATPFGQMMMAVTTERIQVEEEENRLAVQVDYSLEINYEQVSRCHVNIEASSRKEARLHLS